MMRPVQFPLLAMTAFALACATSAQAGRPLQTDDAGVVERGGCEIEAAVSRDKAAGVTGHLGYVQLDCGLPASTELAVALYRSRREGDTAHARELNGKTQLWEGAATAAGATPSALSVSYGLAWSREAPQDWRHAANRLNLVYTHGLPLGSALHLNLGHVRYQAERRSATTWGIAFEHAGTGTLAPMAELTGDDRSAPCWNAGLRWSPFSPSLSFDLSYGQRMAAGRPRLLAIGLTQAF